MSNEILHKQIVERFNTIFSEAPPEVPDYVSDNLQHDLRPYQEHALSQFIFTQEIDEADLYSNHLLFHMATGERVIIVTGCINVLESRVSGTSINNNSCIY